VHLEGNGELVDLPHRLIVAALPSNADVVVASVPAAAAAIAAAAAATGTTRVLLVVNVGDRVVEISPVVMAAVAIPAAVDRHESRQAWLADKGIPVQNVESPFLVQAFDVDVRHDVVALGLGDWQPRMDRPRHSGIVDAGAPFPKGTVSSASLLLLLLLCCVEKNQD
jgi:hypothetical protein